MLPHVRRPAALAAIALLLGACADQPVAPLAPGGSPPRLAAGGQPHNAGGLSSLDLIEADRDLGVLDKENTNRYREYAVSAPEKLPAKYRSSEKGKDATYSMVQLAKEWSSLSAATRKEIRDLRANGFGNLKEVRETEHFVLHYTRQGDWAVPAQDADRNGTPDFIDAAARSWEEVYQREVVQLGYPAPKVPSDVVGTPTAKFNVYYKDMPFYGYCVPENVVLEGLSPVPVGTASAWIVVENDFAGFVRNDEDVTGLETVRTGALKVTQAHEFMHALQFNINVYQSGWLFESHATWAEDAVYDRVNDWHWYINSFFRTPALPVQNRYVYGSAYFMNWLSETYGVDAPRRVWEASRSATAIEAVRSAALGGAFDPIKAFAPAQIALGINDFDGSEGTSSVQPNPALLLRARHAAYPVSVTVPPSTAKVPNGAPSGLGSNFVEFTPAAGAASDLTLTFDGADGPAWRAYAVVTGRRGVTTVPIALDGGAAGSHVVRDFGGGVTRVVLAVTIADRPGVRVPFAYGAALGATVASR
jgi:hypothetical protein